MNTRRAIAAAVFVFALTVSPYAHAQTSVVPIGDPYTDTLQLWSSIAWSIEYVVQEAAAATHGFALSLRSLATSVSNLQGQTSSQTAAAALATPSNPDATTTSANPFDTAITSQQPPASNSPEEATSDQTTLSQNVKSATLEPSNPNKSAISAPPNATTGALTATSPLAVSGTFLSPTSNFVTQDELTTQLLLLANALTAKFSAPATSPVPQYIAAGGNSENPFAAENAINYLSNVTITNANLTASEIPDLSGKYLSLNGGTLTGAFQDTSTATSTLAGALGIGTTSPNYALDVSSTGPLAQFIDGGGNTVEIDPPGGNLLETHAEWATGLAMYVNNNNANGSPVIDMYKSRGTGSAPSAVQWCGSYECGDYLGAINFGGYDGSSYGLGAAIYASTDENWTPTSHESHLAIYFTPQGQTTQDEMVQFGGRDGQNNNGTNVLFYYPINFYDNIWTGDHLSNDGQGGLDISRGDGSSGAVVDGERQSRHRYHDTVGSVFHLAQQQYQRRQYRRRSGRPAVRPYHCFIHRRSGDHYAPRYHEYGQCRHRHHHTRRYSRYIFFGQ
jgi:hypothetical protein